MISIDEKYFAWLYSQICDTRTRDLRDSYWHLAEQLYCKEFVWFVPNDDNRNEEGIELRKEFIEQEEVPYPGDPWVYMSCSMLELLIGLSRRLSFLDEKPVNDWFWELIDNAGLYYANDFVYDFDVEEDVDSTLDRIIWRLYNSDGDGGLFPLKHPNEDQRTVELWYQMSAYLSEKLWP